MKAVLKHNLNIHGTIYSENTILDDHNSDYWYIDNIIIGLKLVVENTEYIEIIPELGDLIVPLRDTSYLSAQYVYPITEISDDSIYINGLEKCYLRMSWLNKNWRFATAEEKDRYNGLLVGDYLLRLDGYRGAWYFSPNKVYEVLKNSHDVEYPYYILDDLQNKFKFNNKILNNNFWEILTKDKYEDTKIDKLNINSVLKFTNKYNCSSINVTFTQNNLYEIIKINKDRFVVIGNNGLEIEFPVDFYFLWFDVHYEINGGLKLLSDPIYDKFLIKNKIYYIIRLTEDNRPIIINEQGNEDFPINVSRYWEYIPPKNTNNKESLDELMALKQIKEIASKFN